MRSRIEASFSKGNTSQEIMGAGGGGLWAKISSAIQTQCVSNRANFLWLLDEQRQCWLNMGLIRKQDAFTLLLPFLFSSLLFSLVPAALSLHLWSSVHLSSLVKLFKPSPSCLFISSHPVCSLSLYLSLYCWSFSFQFPISAHVIL